MNEKKKTQKIKTNLRCKRENNNVRRRSTQYASSTGKYRRITQTNRNYQNIGRWGISVDYWLFKTNGLKLVSDT